MSTPFNRKVWDTVSLIPAGRVVTYAELARAVACASPRAIGQALKRNPYAPEVPCHRVIRSDLSAGGYHGKTAGPELRKKVSLLESEGVSFDLHGLLADKGKLYQIPAP